MLAIRATLAAGLAVAMSGLAHAQTDPALTPAPEAASPVSAAPATLVIPAGTEIVVEIVTPLSSRTSQTGQVVQLRLVDPIMIDGQIAIPEGTEGAGEVIDAAPSGLGGRQGKLVVSGRYLQFNGQQIRIRGMTLNRAGESMTNTSTAVTLMPVVGIIGPFITGGNIEIPTGSRAAARIAVATTVNAPVPSQAALVETSATAPATDLPQEATTEGQQQ